MSNRKKQRVCPNPLFLKWLEDWRDEAKEKNSKLQYTYGKVKEISFSETTTRSEYKIHVNRWDKGITGIEMNCGL